VGLNLIVVHAAWRWIGRLILVDRKRVVE